MDKEYRELNKEYKKRFGNFFPTSFVSGTSQEEYKELIRYCLEKNEPYEVEIDESIEY